MTATHAESEPLKFSIDSLIREESSSDDQNDNVSERSKTDSPPHPHHHPHHSAQHPINEGNPHSHLNSISPDRTNHLTNLFRPQLRPPPPMFNHGIPPGHPLYPWMLPGLDNWQRQAAAAAAVAASGGFGHPVFGGGPGPAGHPLFPPIHPFLLHPYRKPKRIRTAFNPNQLLKLEQAFEKNHYVVGAERKQLAASLNLTETQVRQRHE